MMMLSKLLFTILLFCSLNVRATPDLSLEVNRFYSSGKSFAEISIYVVGSSLTCLETGSEQYGVSYILFIKDVQENIVTGDRYRMVSKDCPTKDLIDMKRISLPAGTYTIEIEMTDIHDSLNTISVIQKIEIETLSDKPQISDVQLLSIARSDPGGQGSLNKSGLYIEPLAFGYYYSALDKLNAYTETYHTDQVEGQAYIQYTLRPLSGDIPAPVVAYRKVNKNKTDAHLFQLDIAHLISGSYVFEAALYDGSKTMVTSESVLFSRSNPVGDSLYISSGSLNLDASFIKQIPEDSLDYHLRAMAPIVGSTEVDIMNSLLIKGSARSKQFFIHRYWSNEAGKYADQAFAAYMKVARAVDDLFRSGLGYGFETDRGHIFLKYGKPDDVIEVEDESSAPPYEIWFYNSFPATHQTNVRFLFYNPSLTQNGFTLLHSTAHGEIKNERWEIDLYRDATHETPGVNAKTMGDNVNRNARRYFEN